MCRAGKIWEFAVASSASSAHAFTGVRTATGETSYASFGPVATTLIYSSHDFPPATLTAPTWRMYTIQLKADTWAAYRDGVLSGSGTNSPSIPTKTTTLNYIGRGSTPGEAFAQRLEMRYMAVWMTYFTTDHLNALHADLRTTWGL